MPLFSLDLPNLLQSVAVVQGFIFATILLHRGWAQERYSDYWLAVLLLALSCYLCRYVLSDIDPDNNANMLNQFLRLSYYVTGVVIYFYFKSQINHHFRVTRKDFWHFLPVLIYFLWFLLRSSYFYLYDTKQESPLFFTLLTVFYLTYRSVGTLIYLFFSWRLYQKYRAWLPTERSDSEGVTFKWFRAMLLTLSSIVVSGILLNLFDNFVFTTPYWLDTGQELVIAFGIYYISLMGYMQYQPQQLVYVEPTNHIEEKEATTPTLLIAKMSATELEEWKNKILVLMSQEKLYLNLELTLTDFAQRLQTHSKLISAVINEAFDKNFNDFVNEYRVHLFKEKVNDPALKHLTLLGIAFECGFNSKSTFNRAVKKATGEMPSAFVQ